MEWMVDSRNMRYVTFPHEFVLNGHTENFWDVYNQYKDKFLAAGLKVHKNKYGKWEIYLPFETNFVPEKKCDKYSKDIAKDGGGVFNDFELNDQLLKLDWRPDRASAGQRDCATPSSEFWDYYRRVGKENLKARKVYIYKNIENRWVVSKPSCTHTTPFCFA